MINAITNFLGFIVKNINMITGVIGAITKAIIAVIHFWKPEQDNWVDITQDINEWIQENLFKWAKYLCNLGK